MRAAPIRETPSATAVAVLTLAILGCANTQSARFDAFYGFVDLDRGDGRVGSQLRANRGISRVI